MPNGQHAGDNIPAEDLPENNRQLFEGLQAAPPAGDLAQEDRPENNLHLFEYIFPIGTFAELLGQHEYADVQVAPDGDRVYCYDVIMRCPHAVEPALVRQHLEQAVQQIPETPTAHLQWRVELSAVVVTDQQIAA